MAEKILLQYLYSVHISSTGIPQKWHINNKKIKLT